ncbi:hypothetical protein JR316_0012380 [Psilocybe cubensis]|uniref:Uncharacterized protein n=2 Tax=Psilocybe cubensis TaxID=181762 RepID=A0ACB8GI43_PSICU|nr:hypothetical protein JR316_0012380 [Psilocybe cubensis]KAH9475269.1 hypothetical protein JR316_0012380 [Psilocybe cubensis]
MSFLHRRRSLQAPLLVKEKEKDQKQTVPAVSLIPAPSISAAAAIENVPRKGTRTRTTSALGVIKRVSSIFTGSTPRKKAPPSLSIVDHALETNSRPRSFNFEVSSIISSTESEDDIRRPSGLGSPVALTIHSNLSLPPSPFSPTGPQEVYNAYTFDGNGEYQRTRAVSSPNLLRSLSWKVREKVKAHHASITPSPTSEQPPSPLSRMFSIQFPSEILVLVMAHLPRHDVAIAATVSKLYAAAARKALYDSLDFDSLSPSQAERLIAQLASRRDLTDLVTTFVCRAWPPFYMSGSGVHGQPSAQNGREFKHQDALLTATFTLALERMSNLHSLTLPSFDPSLLSQYSVFGLRSLTLLNHASTDTEIKEILTWLDAQANITCLRFPNLEDIPPKASDIPVLNLDDTQSTTEPSTPFLRPYTSNGLSPHVSPLSSPRSTIFHSPSTPPSPSAILPASTLLPNLKILHASSTLAMLLLPSEPHVRQTLTSVTLNISATLYNGLRPAALMCALKGITHLSLRFSENVDKRTLEKVVGAAGASLGLVYHKSPVTVDVTPPDDSQTPPISTSSNNERSGLRSLEISFPKRSTAPSGREEALYKSLHASLARYKMLTSLRLFVDHPDQPDEQDYDGVDSDAQKEKGKHNASTPPPPSALELILISSWVKLCPTLEFITLFSGSRWDRATQPIQKTQSEPKVFKFP